MAPPAPRVPNPAYRTMSWLLLGPLITIGLLVGSVGGWVALLTHRRRLSTLEGQLRQLDKRLGGVRHDILDRLAALEASRPTAMASHGQAEAADHRSARAPVEDPDAVETPGGSGEEALGSPVPLGADTGDPARDPLAVFDRQTDASALEPTEPAAAAAPATQADDIAGSAEPQASAGKGGPVAVAGPASGGRSTMPGVPRWLTWTGGVVLMIGLALFVLYTVESGWLTPAVRTVLGLMAGIGLVGLGERLRRTELARGRLRGIATYLPQVVSSTGLAAAYLSLYAAHVWHGLIGATPVFAAMALVAAVAVALSLWQGPIIAVIGLGGAWAVPFLIATATPDIVAFLSYILGVAFGGLAMARYHRIWWLWVLAAVGSLLLLTLVGRQVPLAGQGDGALAAAHLLMAVLFMVLHPASLSGVSAFDLPTRRVGRAMIPHGLLVRLSWSLAIAALALAALVGSGFALPHQMAVAVLIVGAVAAARLIADGKVLMIAGLMLSIGAVLLLPSLPPPPPEVAALPETLWWPTGWQAALALLVIWTFLPLWGRQDDPTDTIVWSAAGAVGALGCLTAGWLAHEDAIPATIWAGIALVAAAGQIGLTTLRRVQPGRQNGPEVLAHAIAGFALIGLAAIMRFEEAQLTTALAVIVFAAAVVVRRIPVAGVRPVIGVLSLAIAVHGVLHPGGTADQGWLNGAWLGLGLPLALLVGTRRILGPWAERNAPADLTAAAAMIAAATLACIQITWLVPDPPIGLTPPSRLQVAGYTAVGVVAIAGWLLAGRHAIGYRVVLPFIAALTALAAVLGLGVLRNPLFWPEPILGWPVLNEATAVYLGGSVIFLVLGRLAAARVARLQAAVTDSVAAVGVILWATIEVRLWFHPDGMLVILWGGYASPFASQQELTALSATWLVLGLVGVAVATVLRHQPLRRLALLLIMATSVKVVLIDFAAQSGLWRALSFILLGAVMIAAGWLEYRLGHRPRGADPPAPVRRA